MSILGSWVLRNIDSPGSEARNFYDEDFKRPTGRSQEFELDPSISRVSDLARKVPSVTGLTSADSRVY